MTPIVIGLISFVAIFGGVLIGIFCAHRLPEHHLSGQTQSAITSLGRGHRHFVGPRPQLPRSDFEEWENSIAPILEQGRGGASAHRLSSFSKVATLFFFSACLRGPGV